MYRESKYIKYMYYKSFTNDYKGIKLSEASLDFVCAPILAIPATLFWKMGVSQTRAQ